MMLCAQCEGLLPAFVDEQLPPAQMQRIDKHVQSCQSCLRALRRQRETRDLLERLDEARWTPPDLRLRVALALRQQDAARSGTRRSRLLVPVVAAVLALGLTVGGVAMGPLSSGIQTPALAPASNAWVHGHGRSPALAIEL